MGWFKDTFAPDAPTKLRKKRAKDPAVMARLNEQERTYFLLRSHNHDQEAICAKMNINKETAEFLEYKLTRL